MKTTLLMALLCVSSFANAAPYYVSRDGRPLYPPERTTCGNDDTKPVATLSPALQKLGRPIGFMKVQVPGGIGICSGTLVGPDLFLTAQHCEGACQDTTVTFGYVDRAEETFACKEIVEKGNDEFNGDYLLMRLQGKPGVCWGWYPLSNRKQVAGAPLTLLHHPEGKPMQLSKTGCQVVGVEDGMVHHRCDTESGSSGGGLLSGDINRPQTLRVVGVHTLGGCDATEATYNSGVSIADLLPHSQALPPLVKPVCCK